MIKVTNSKVGVCKMYISKIKLENFRSFSGEHDIIFNSGINFFVGNNNSGKTTIFKAIEFLQNGKNKEEWITKGKESRDVSVEVTFSGDDIPDIVSDGAIKKYQDFVFDENGTKNLRILRTSADIKKAQTWNNEKNQFENPTGVGNMITALFDAQFVYSDLKNEDYQDFGKTKIVGKLVNAITADFQKSDPYQKLRQAHNDAFGEGSELIGILAEISEKIQKVITEQYGEAKVDFNFGLPEMENFFKNGSINLTDNGITTDVSEKGTGMQRALAMSLIQVYSEVSNAENAKQLFFFVDEPETFLHPIAQDKLIESFERISKNSQVFITTHSPYLLKKFNKSNHEIKLFSSIGEKVTVGEKMDLFPFSPTWGEINYFSFGVASVEFHNELFGYIQEQFNRNQLQGLLEEEINEKQIKKRIGKLTNENSFDEYLKESGLSQNIQYVRQLSDGRLDKQQKTLPMFVRNIIHHPENTNNSFTNKQLIESIQLMIDIIYKIKEDAKGLILKHA